MSRVRFALVLTVGVVLGFAASLWNPLLAQGDVRSCSIARNFGTVKAAWDEWLVFENEQNGTIRLVDDRCRVRQIMQKGR